MKVKDLLALVVNSDICIMAPNQKELNQDKQLYLFDLPKEYSGLYQELMSEKLLESEVRGVVIRSNTLRIYIEPKGWKFVKVDTSAGPTF